ncbi:hypothetical protein H7X46_21535 [Pseudonocardia sp. C8]|uniref:hypothetical protein n=1 Tax=Pseudonocardia sp. C8 TaxID=2762759 RepID=UPI001642C891|nr:hypothetical protein [Pseudonocardia sp. C8]MBC3193643.1 hypothetical protein [Pseudonocardia sp. C8]
MRVLHRFDRPAASAIAVATSVSTTLTRRRLGGRHGVGEEVVVVLGVGLEPVERPGEAGRCRAEQDRPLTVLRMVRGRFG